MPYQLFRLSLMARRKPPLLEALQSTRETTRQEHLRAAFGQRVHFAIRAVAYSYVHIEEIDGTIVGRVGRKGVERPAGPPETGFAPEEHSVHFAANLFIDTAGDPDGQRLAFQINPRVGSPRLVTEALIQKINAAGVDTAAWQIDVHPITNANTFWNAVKKHENEITQIQITFSAPNVLGIFDNVTSELDTAKKNENNAAAVSVSLENRDGIKVDTPSIRKAIEHIAKGVGNAVLRKGRKKLFDTNDKQPTISVDGDTPAAQGKADMLSSIKRALFGR